MCNRFETIEDSLVQRFFFLETIRKSKESNVDQKINIATTATTTTTTTRWVRRKSERKL